MNVKTLSDLPPWSWPHGAGKMLLDILRDGRAAETERRLVAELAGDLTVIDDEMVDALLAILRRGDASEPLRGAAAIALGPVLEAADMRSFDDPEEVPIVERTFHRIQESLHGLYMDAALPRDVRRRILEASVRAPQDWHPDAVRAAYQSDDAAWRLTAVFCMRFVRGFGAQILEALDSGDPDVHYEAVCAAGVWQVDAAWPRVRALVTSPGTDKALRLAAIEAVATIRPHEAAAVLVDLDDSRDEDIADAVDEALTMAAGLSDDGDDDD